jgi:hypothetical protein
MAQGKQDQNTNTHACKQTYILWVYTLRKYNTYALCSAVDVTARILGVHALSYARTLLLYVDSTVCYIAALVYTCACIVYMYNARCHTAQ